MPKKTTISELERMLDNDEETPNLFSAKEITKDDWDNLEIATNSILKILKDSVMSEREIEKIISNSGICKYNSCRRMDLAKAIREQQLKELTMWAEYGDSDEKLTGEELQKEKDIYKKRRADDFIFSDEWESPYE